MLGIRIRMFLGLPDPNPLVRGMDPAPDLSLFLIQVFSGLILTQNFSKQLNFLRLKIIKLN
jgi:hypothetical protein